MSIESTSRCRRCRQRRRRTRLGLVRDSSVLVPCRYVCKKNNKFLYSLCGVYRRDSPCFAFERHTK